MVNSYRAVLILLIFFFTSAVQAQQFPVTEYSAEQLAEELFPAQDIELNYEELYESLAQLLAHPLDLNKATADDLRALFILKESQIDELIHHREENGAFLSVYELQCLASFDMATLYKLMPLVMVRDDHEVMDVSILKRLLAEKNNYFLLRYERTLEDRKGYLSSTDSDSRYAGSADKLYARFRVNKAKDYSVGFTLEKDAGETFAWDIDHNKPGFDYYSFHAQLANKGKFRNIIMGDYQAQFGQGLALGGGFGMGKGAETITAIRRSGGGFIPYTSINEFGFFRGAALSYAVTSSLFVHAFGSQRHRDGRMVEDTVDDQAAYVSSLIATGFHRTAGEWAARQQVRETNYGTVLQLKTLSLEAGLLFHQTLLDVPLYRTASLYNHYSFSGDRNANMGVYLNYNYGSASFFSEVVQTAGGGRGYVAGVLTRPTRQLEVSLLYRKYDRDFQSLYSNAVAENTFAQNEEGLYWGYKYAFNKKYSLTGYVDLFRFAWLRFRGYAPSNGSEWLARFTYQPDKATLIYLQAREENKIRNIDSDTPIYQTSVGRKRNGLINLDYRANRRWSFKTRAQWSSYTLDRTTHGFVLLQDVTAKLGKLSISARYALFDTDDYDNRQYVYEKDMWLAMSLPAYYGKGVRQYVLLHYAISAKIDVWLRWARTGYLEQDVIGSGGEQIAGNTRNDLKFQVRLRL